MFLLTTLVIIAVDLSLTTVKLLMCFNEEGVFHSAELEWVTRCGAGN